MMWFQSQFVLVVLIFLIVSAIFFITEIFRFIINLCKKINRMRYIPKQIFYGILWSFLFMLVCFNKVPVFTSVVVVLILTGTVVRVYYYKEYIKQLKDEQKRRREERRQSVS